MAEPGEGALLFLLQPPKTSARLRGEPRLPFAGALSGASRRKAGAMSLPAAGGWWIWGSLNVFPLIPVLRLGPSPISAERHEVPALGGATDLRPEL